MGGLLHMFDFSQGKMARKKYMHKQQVDGLEAPRNNLELPTETSLSYHVTDDSALYSCDVKEEWSERNHYPTKRSMKKLIKEEISKRPNTRHSAPSIVARLMGIDSIPLDTESVDQKHENRKKEWSERGSVSHVPSNSHFYRHLHAHHQRYKERDHVQSRTTLKSAKFRPREHPQENELEKFKKDFEAWQAARLRECSRVFEVESMPKYLLAQERCKEKMALAYSRKTASMKAVNSNVHLVKSCSYERSGSQHLGYKKDPLSVEQSRESYSAKRRTMSMDFERFPVLNSDQELDKYAAASRIVILKPGPNGIGNYEEPCSSSSGISEERGGIEDFLEEVKQKLKYEMQGKTIRRSNVVRGGGIETPFSENPSDPKQIARHIAEQIREGASRDLGINLLRSESTRSYRSEYQFDEPGSSEFTDGYTRQFLSERFRNTLKEETDLDFATAAGRSSRLTAKEDDNRKPDQTGHIIKTGPGMQTGYFRCEPDDDALCHQEFSPRNLIRSLSAPVSGTSFGKLLLEDCHVLTGVHIRRKQEASENVVVDVKKQKREKLNFREKVSNFRNTFTLRGRLFGRRIQSVLETDSNEHDVVNDLMSGPTVVLNSCNWRENSTEVPPSPASVCSSANEEVWRSADHLSPVSTLDLSAGEDISLPEVFREISSSLNELRRQLNELESDGSETVAREEPLETEMVELEDQAKAYTRDLLIASGLYDKPSDRTLLRGSPHEMPISNHVFEEVEESYKKLAKESERFVPSHGDVQVDHKVLLDLVNEALSAVLGPPVSLSGFMRKVLSQTSFPPPRGRRLLDRVWEIMSKHVYPSTDVFNYLLENLVARDMSVPWSGLTTDEFCALGREMECLIIGDLIEEIVKEMEARMAGEVLTFFPCDHS